MTHDVRVPLVLLAALLSSCELDVAIGSTPRARPPPGPPAPVTRTIDILFVVDNSGSMLEEQEQLSRTLFDPRCPIQSLTEVPEAFRFPEGDTLDALLDTCGLVQMLAAFDHDFRIGAITTDVNACDNFIPEAQGGPEYGYHPQRGCLQPVPSTGQRFIGRFDVNVPGRFQEIVSDAVRTFGSPFERGFDAVDAFLEGDTFVDECAGDRELFLRDEAALLIVFVTDEDDCSHADGAFGFDDETSAECATATDVVTEHRPQDCYERRDTLAPTAAYVERWRALKGPGRELDVRVALLGGAVLTGNGDVVPSGCLLDDNGVVRDACVQSRGLSSFTGPGDPCDPAAQTCCTGDAATRYFELLGLFEAGDPRTATAGSICAPLYVDTLLSAARLGETVPPPESAIP